MIEETNISKAFSELISNYSEANRLVEKLKENGQLLLFGGAVRQYMKTEGYKKLPRDFDIVIEKNSSTIDLDDVLNEFSYKKNRFNGYKINVDSLEFDIWEIENTWAFKENKVKCSEFEYSKKLQETVFLNVDSIVFNLTTEEFYKDKYDDAIKNRELDIVLSDNPYQELNLLRAIVLKQEYNMGLSDKLRNKLLDFIEIDSNYLDTLYDIQLSHYNFPRISKEQLEDELKLIIEY